jgi:hypothetical protein
MNPAAAFARYRIDTGCKEKIMRALLAGLALLSTAAFAAEPDKPTVDPVFECHRLNYAWGFAMTGAVIDRNGDIYRYQLRGKDSRPQPVKENGADYYPAAGLRAQLAEATKGGSVDKDKLAANAALIAKAAAGKLARSDTGVRDAGSSTCHAYTFDAAAQRYRDVELGSDGGVGDFKLVNDAPEAKTLLDWLKSVGVAQ